MGDISWNTKYVFQGSDRLYALDPLNCSHNRKDSFTSQWDEGVVDYLFFLNYWSVFEYVMESVSMMYN